MHLYALVTFSHKYYNVKTGAEIIPPPPRPEHGRLRVATVSESVNEVDLAETVEDLNIEQVNEYGIVYSSLRVSRKIYRFILGQVKYTAGPGKLELTWLRDNDEAACTTITCNGRNMDEKSAEVGKSFRCGNTTNKYPTERFMLDLPALWANYGFASYANNNNITNQLQEKYPIKNCYKYKDIINQRPYLLEYNLIVNFLDKFYDQDKALKVYGNYGVEFERPVDVLKVISDTHLKKLVKNLFRYNHIPSHLIAQARRADLIKAKTFIHVHWMQAPLFHAIKNTSNKYTNLRINR